MGLEIKKSCETREYLSKVVKLERLGIDRIKIYVVYVSEGIDNFKGISLFHIF